MGGGAPYLFRGLQQVVLGQSLLGLNEKLPAGDGLFVRDSHNPGTWSALVSGCRRDPQMTEDDMIAARLGLAGELVETHGLHREDARRRVLANPDIVNRYAEAINGENFEITRPQLQKELAAELFRRSGRTN